LIDSKQTSPKQTDKTPEQLAFEKERRIARRSKISKLVRAREAELRRRIDTNEQLKKDFQFFVQRMNFPPDDLINGLYWDCNMIHADPQTVVSGIKSETWPIDEQSLRKILRNINTAAQQIDKVNKTTLSPGNEVVVLDNSGFLLERHKEKSLLAEFGRLPEILRIYHKTLKRGVEEAADFWPKESERMRRLVEHARHNSLYERIRLTSPDHKYHANRLHRLVSAAREMLGLTPVTRRSFIVWLNKLKKRTAQQRRQTPS
jgi:hypothetical protein